MSAMLEKIGWYVNKNIDTVFQGSFDSNNLLENALIMETTGGNTVISPDFLVWKLCRNCAFPQNLHTRKSGEITVFFAVDTEAYSETNERSKMELFAKKKKRSGFSR